MRNAFLLLYLFFSLNISAQYRLDLALGYNHPDVQKTDTYQTFTDSTRERSVYKNMNGFNFKIGITQPISKWYSQNYGINLINRNYIVKTETTEYQQSWDDYPPALNSTTYGFNLVSGQLFYNARFILFEKLNLYPELGISYEREIFSSCNLNGVKDIDFTPKNNDYSFIGLKYNIGLIYEHDINEKWKIYSEFLYSSDNFNWSDSYIIVPYGGLRSVKDVRLQVGLTYQFSDRDFDLRKRINRIRLDNKRWKKERNTDSLIFQNIDLKLYYGQKLRKIPHDESNGYYGNSSEYYFSDQEEFKSNGIGIGIGYSRNRLYLSGNIDFEHYKNNFILSYVKSYHHPKLPWGTIQDFYKEKDYFFVSFQRLNFAVGVGVQLLHPKKKVNIIPSVKLAQGFLVSKRIKDDYFVKSRVYNWDGSPVPSSNFHWDSIFYPSRFKINNAAAELMVGATFTAEIAGSFHLTWDLFYGLSSTSIIAHKENTYVDRLKLYSTAGIAYRIPMEDKRKPIKVKTPYDPNAPW